MKPIIIAQITDLHIKPARPQLAYGKVDTAAALQRTVSPSSTAFHPAARSDCDFRSPRRHAGAGGVRSPQTHCWRR